MLAVRSEVIEFGAAPVAPWLAQLDSVQAIIGKQRQLLQVGVCDDQGRCFVTLQAVSAALETTLAQTQVLAELLAGVALSPDLVQRARGGAGAEVAAVEVTSLALLLFMHQYLREAHRAETSDVWPTDLVGSQAEPSSPMRMAARAWGAEAGGGHQLSPQGRPHLPLVRQQLAEHLDAAEAALKGAPAYLARHAATLLSLAAAAAPAAAAGASPAGHVAAHELDRLAFLVRAQGLQEGGAQGMEVGDGGGGGGGGGRTLEGGSPMDVCATPFTEAQGAALSEAAPFFGAGQAAAAPAEAVAAWLAEALRAPGDDTSDLMVASGSSPPRPPPLFNQLAPPGTALAGPGDVAGACRATVVRGEADFGASAPRSFRVLDCHDCAVYALAPLAHVLLAACRDCVVVLGAVGGVLRVERCERVQVIAAARSVTVNTCHDCILYLGANTAPVVLGDNRFVQLAPYTAGYESLPTHMALAGVAAEPNLWDQPLLLLPDHSRHSGAGSLERASPSPASAMALSHPASPPQEQQRGGFQFSPGAAPPEGQALRDSSPSREPPGSPMAGMAPSVTLLPPAKLMPFWIPFRGGAGPLCGGPAHVNIGIRASADSLPNFMAMGEEGGSFPRSPFPLPPPYLAAWEERMRGAADVRTAVKAANLEDSRKRELMAAIQAHFKDWLQATGAMRQVYDLARAERDESSNSLVNTL